jgi:phospholipase/carboxylesterase
MDYSTERTGKLLARGAPLEEAAACALMLHGRGASAESILVLADMLGVENICYLAPQAPDYSWYPYSFLDEIAKNRAAIDHSLGTMAAILELVESTGPGIGRTALVGFSQGACLASEYIANNPMRYGALVCLAGGLIGPVGASFSYSGSVDRMPVFLGCGDPDPHIPRSRMEETAEVLKYLGANVDLRFYPGIGHTVNDDEVERVRALLAGLTG